MTRLKSAVIVMTPLLALMAMDVGSENFSAQNAKIARGEYITHHVAMCVQCHTPRDRDGNLISTLEFHGAPIPVERPLRGKAWAFAAPNIHGLAGWREDEVVHLLETGERYDGRSPQPPMPPFRMSREDAEAVVAYLKSL